MHLKLGNWKINSFQKISRWQSLTTDKMRCLELDQQKEVVDLCHVFTACLRSHTLALREKMVHLEKWSVKLLDYPGTWSSPLEKHQSGKAKVTSPTALAKSGVPRGRGCKGGEPPRKRAKSAPVEERVPFSALLTDAPLTNSAVEESSDILNEGSRTHLSLSLELLPFANCGRKLKRLLLHICSHLHSYHLDLYHLS